MMPPPRSVANSACTGEVYDQGAQVTRWAPIGNEPVLYVSNVEEAARLLERRTMRSFVMVPPGAENPPILLPCASTRWPCTEAGFSRQTSSRF